MNGSCESEQERMLVRGCQLHVLQDRHRSSSRPWTFLTHHGSMCSQDTGRRKKRPALLWRKYSRHTHSTSVLMICSRVVGD